ncbi:MAG: radical SAM family heme chaperone HemW [Solobacterium sp.]|nr:radical SAM family heme chaperone HemW [Solobacterium sp.]
MKTESAESLYVHVPFCRTVCAYCDFARQAYREKTADAWLAALQKELSLRDIGTYFRTVYIGGGTPTSLNAAQLERLLSILRPYTLETAEYTCEINPETLDAQKAGLLKEYGVDRVSVGLQDIHEDMLRLMNRHHTKEDVQAAVSLLRENGINNISLDIMYSLPQQTMGMLEETLSFALGLDPDHLSLYSLTIEENSVFGKKGIEHLDDETEADMYMYLIRRLTDEGYAHYEISNFAKAGKQSLHNRNYWLYEDFTGVSCGASGKSGDMRYDNTRSLKEYLEDPLKRQVILLDEEDRMFETLMMNLRLREGMELSHFRELNGSDFEDVYGETAGRLAAKGLLEFGNGRVRCTERGFFVLNDILEEFL